MRNSGSASTSTLQAADATVRAALADACERELKAAAAAAGDYDGSISPDLSSALQDDVQRLADLDAAWRLASNPPPLPLAAPEPLDLRDLPDPVDPLLPNIDGRLESDRRDDIEQSLRLLGSHYGEMEEGDARGGVPCSNDGGASSLQHPAAVSSNGEEVPVGMTHDEVQRFLEGYSRQRTILLFRLEKKRILSRCAQLLRSR